MTYDESLLANCSFPLSPIYIHTIDGSQLPVVKIGSITSTTSITDWFAFSPPKCLYVQKPSLILQSIRQLTMPSFYVPFSSSNCVLEQFSEKHIGTSRKS